MNIRTKIVLGVLAITLLLTGILLARDTDERAVRGTVSEFGEKLQMVSLMAPPEAVAGAVRTHYTDLVTPAFLEVLKKDTFRVPGRLTSSPWPDRIDITSVTRQDNGSFIVQGTVIEITSEEAVRGGVAASYPVTLTLEKEDGRWLISNFERGAYAYNTTSTMN